MIGSQGFVKFFWFTLFLRKHVAHLLAINLIPLKVQDSLLLHYDIHPKDRRGFIASLLILVSGHVLAEKGAKPSPNLGLAWREVSVKYCQSAPAGVAPGQGIAVRYGVDGSEAGCPSEWRMDGLQAHITPLHGYRRRPKFTKCASPVEKTSFMALSIARSGATVPSMPYTLSTETSTLRPPPVPESPERSVQRTHSIVHEGLRSATQEACATPCTEVWIASLWSRASPDCDMHVKKSAMALKPELKRRAARQASSFKLQALRGCGCMQGSSLSR
jgi:hypothetical protein